MLVLGAQEHREAPAESGTEKPTFCQREKSWTEPRVCLLAPLILGIVISYVLFFPLEKERQREVPEPCRGQAEIYGPLSVLGLLLSP